jgi:hypothetical protein
VTLLVAAHPVIAGGLTPGDGSGFDNLDLVENPALGCDNCVPNPAPEPYDPPFEPDWSLALRGSVTTDSEGGDPVYEMIALPSLTLEQQGIRGGYSVELSGEIVVPLEDEARLSSVEGSVTAGTALDAETTLEGTASLSLSQDAADDPLIAANPLVASGAVEGSVTRQLSQFELTGRGNAGRTVNGETVYADDTTADNSFDNTTVYGGGGRLGLHLTPSLTAFVDADAQFEVYDEVSPGLLVPLDNLTYAARAGLTAVHGEDFEAEASVGYAWRDFADETIEDTAALLYDASVTYRPDETVELTGSLTTTLGAPGSTGSAELSYAATGEAAMQVSPWLRLRGSAGWNAGRFIGTDVETRGWAAGLGAAYLLSRNIDLTADYAFERSETTPNPATDEHQLLIGVRFHR